MRRCAPAPCRFRSTRSTPCSTCGVEVGDKTLDFLGRLGRALRQRPHLRGDDGEAAAGVARARRLDAGVQRQQVRLESDLVDHADDLADLLRGFLDAAHRVDGLARDLAALFRIGLGGRDELARMARAFRGLVDRCRDLFERGGSFLEARCLLLGTAEDRPPPSRFPPCRSELPACSS